MTEYATELPSLLFIRDATVREIDQVLPRRPAWAPSHAIHGGTSMAWGFPMPLGSSAGGYGRWSRPDWPAPVVFLIAKGVFPFSLDQVKRFLGVAGELPPPDSATAEGTVTWARLPGYGEVQVTYAEHVIKVFPEDPSGSRRRPPVPGDALGDSLGGSLRLVA